MILIVLAVLVAVGNGFLGSHFCAPRGRARDGFWLGLFFGPLGWIVGLLLPESGPRCRFCLAVVAVGSTRCRHCGAEIARVAAVTESVAMWYVARGDKVEGPFSPVQISTLLRAGKLTASDRCLRVGTEEWLPLSQVLC